MRTRLILAIVGVVAFVLLIHDVPLSGHLERVERDRLVTQLERDAFILAGRSQDALEGGTAADDPVLLRLVADYSNQEEVRVVVVDSAGVGVLGSVTEPTVGIGFTNRPEIVKALDGIANNGQRASETLGADLFFVAVPVLSGQETVGAVRLSAPAQVVDDRTARRVRGLFSVAAISLVIAFAVAWLMASMIALPLSRLRAATRGLAAGDLSTRAQADTGPADLQQLAGSFNTMADRIEDLVERQRAFAGTVSHQLRTPLTALKLRLEQIRDDVADNPQAESRATDAIAECDRLHRIVEGLLALARADQERVAPTIVDLSTVVREACEQWSALAEERGVSIETAISSTRPVSALPDAPQQIIDNLVDNALEVSPAGSRLLLAVAEAVDPSGQLRVELHVIDEGPGLSAEDRRRAFDRFWRKADSDQQGSGLGLAIVAQLVGAAGGTTRLDAAPSGGVDAVVGFLPAETIGLQQGERGRTS